MLSTIFAYGDSWTIGEGSTTDKNNWSDFSWVKLLSENYNLNYKNNGISGNSNSKIFNAVVHDVKNSLIKKGDFICIMWSSSLRDSVPYLPNDEWISWSIKHLIDYPNKFYDSSKDENKIFKQFIKNYKVLFVNELFNQNYYNIINQNYIIFIQKLLEFYEINYIMCDSIERTIINLQENDDVTQLINKKTYWGFNAKSMREFLFDLNRNDIWESEDIEKIKHASVHPNKLGYRFIYEEIKNFIDYNKLLKNS